MSNIIDVFEKEFISNGNNGYINEGMIIEVYEDHYDQKFRAFLEKNNLNVLYDEDEGKYHFWLKGTKNFKRMGTMAKRKGGNPGALVKTKTGITGITRNSDSMIEGKVLVYILDDKFNETGERTLCHHYNLTIIGHVD